MMKSEKPIAVDHLDKEALRLGFLAGARRVIASRKELDRINVFPVPDKDTGANLTATMSAVIRRLRRPHSSVGSVGASITDGALSGAQGNSGVIVAQFFQGLSEEISDVVHVSVDRFVSALRHAAASARKALAQPREGTILTVISDVASHLTKRVHSLPDFKSLIEESVRAARESLARTPEKLDVLRQAGVVDAGALGFVRFLEGLRDYWVDGRGGVAAIELEESDEMEEAEDTPIRAFVEIDFRYCTEAVVHGAAIDRDTVIGALANLGDSVVVAGSGSEIHAHVHSNVPAYVLETLAGFGRIRRTKIEDMLASLDTAQQVGERAGLALVTDSACDLPNRTYVERHIHMVPVRIAFGDETLLDRVEITPREFYDRLQRDPDFPTTSQPSPADFLALYRHLASTHEGILSVHLSAALSGTYQSAMHAARTVSEETGVPISVIDSRSASVAEGLVVWSVARAVEAGCSLDACGAVGRAVADLARIYVFVPTIDNFVRGGRLSPLKGRISNLLRMRPILTVKDAKLAVGAKVLGVENARKRTVRLSMEAADKMVSPIFALSHTAAPELAAVVDRELKQRYPTASTMISDTSPAIGAHAGLGGLAVAVVDAVEIDRLIADTSKGRTP
jgi:DegV family protein with EDD domain